MRPGRLLDLVGAVIFGTLLLAMLLSSAFIPWLSIPEGFLAFAAIAVVSAALAMFFLVKVAGRPTLDMLRGLWRASRKPSPDGTTRRD